MLDSAGCHYGLEVWCVVVQEQHVFGTGESGGEVWAVSIPAIRAVPDAIHSAAEGIEFPDQNQSSIQISLLGRGKKGIRVFQEFVISRAGLPVWRVVTRVGP
jgi:hypothetical protein